jgi:kynurenine formamidase
MASAREQKDPTASIQELAQFLNSMHVIDLSPLLYTNMPHWHRHPDVFINLAQVPTTCYFMAFPLKIKGGSGSPLRPIALFPKG